jgi:hypothetical protein
MLNHFLSKPHIYMQHARIVRRVKKAKRRLSALIALIAHFYLAKAVDQNRCLKKTAG